MQKQTKTNARCLSSLSTLILMLGLGSGLPGGVQAANSYALGNNSIAEGESAIATGRNSIAVGRGAVATGDNLTAAEITQKLADNAAQLNNISNKKLAVQRAQTDFNTKYSTYLEVKNALDKIAEGQQQLNTSLKPALTSAEQALTDYTPIFNTKKQEVEARTENLITMSGFDLTKASTTAGITALAQELKQSAEQGYETIINEPIAYYESYVKNYIQANGNVATAIADYSRLIGANVNSSTSYYHAGGKLQKRGQIYSHSLSSGLWTLPVASTSNSSIAALERYDFDSGARLNFRTPDQTLSLTQADVEQWEKEAEKQKKAAYDMLIATKNIYFSGEGTNAVAETTINQKYDYITALVKSKYYQGLYDKAGNQTQEGLSALQNKLKEEQKMKNLAAALREKNLSKEMEAFFAAWKKENITDIQTKNQQFIADFRANLQKVMADEQKKYDELQQVKTAAQRAISNMEAQLARLEPGEQKRRIAAQADEAKALLTAQESELRALEATLSLNDLRNIGQDAIALGSETRVTGERAVGIGYQNTVTGSNSVALGNQNVVAGQYDIVLGQQNQTPANSENNVVIGRQIVLADNGNTTIKNSVALGYQSSLDNPISTQHHPINQQGYTFAGGSPFGTFSIGAKDKERTLTHLAAGRLSATSTDGINGSQLFSVVQETGKLGTRLSGVERTVQQNKTEIAEQLAHHTTTLTQHAAELNKQQQTLTGHDGRISQNTADITGLRQTVNTHDRTIALNSQSIADNSTAIERNRTTLTQHDTILQRQQQSLDSHSAQLSKHDTDIRTANTAITTNRNTITTNTGNIAKNREDIDALKQGLGSVNTHITNKDNRLTQLSGQVNTQNERLNEHDARLTRHDSQLAAHTTQLESHTAQLTTHNTALQQHSITLVQHSDDINDLKNAQHGQSTLLQQHSERLDGHDQHLAVHSSQLATHTEKLATVETLQERTSETLTQHEHRLKDHDDTIRTVSNQVKGLEANTAKTVFFDDESKQSITLGKTHADGTQSETVIKHVAAGEVKEGSKDAVNGGQLYVTETNLKTALSSSITQLRQEIQQFKPTIHINTSKIVRESVAASNAYTDHRIHELQQHTDNRFARVNRDIRQLRKEARAGVSAAMAVGAIERVPGKKATIGAGVGTYGSETAVAIGLKASLHQQVMFSLAGSIDSQKNVGGSAGISIGF